MDSETHIKILNSRYSSQNRLTEAKNSSIKNMLTSSFDHQLPSQSFIDNKQMYQLNITNTMHIKSRNIED